MSIIVFSYFNRPVNEFEARFEIDDDEIDDSLAVSSCLRKILYLIVACILSSIFTLKLFRNSNYLGTVVD